MQQLHFSIQYYVTTIKEHIFKSNKNESNENYMIY